MAAGDVSRLLVAQIRDKLGDQSMELIKTDNEIYDSLTHWQNHAMIFWQTSRVKFVYPLFRGQSEYEVQERIMNITKVTFNDDIEVIPTYTLPQETPGDDARVITIGQTDQIADGVDRMTIWAFIRPLISDVISPNMDPIIESVYHFYLRELVCSYYIKTVPNVRPFELVERDIRMMASKLRAVERSQSKPVIARKLNW